MTITIRTNNKPRLLLCWGDLTSKEQAEFDYLDEDEREGRDFIRYRGVPYDLNEFSSLSITGTPEFRPWDGCHGDSYFSGVLVRYCRDTDMVIMGTYFS